LADDDDNGDYDSEEEENSKTIQLLLAKIESLRTQLKEAKNREWQVRQELTEKFRQEVEALMTMHSVQLGQQNELNDERLEKKFDILSKTPSKQRRQQGLCFFFCCHICFHNNNNNNNTNFFLFSL